jgi:hypothetical protein
VVDEFDLSAIVGKYEREERGHPPYHPKMMVALLLYAYSVGAPSSRKIEKRCQRRVASRRWRAPCARSSAAGRASGRLPPGRPSSARPQSVTRVAPRWRVARPGLHSRRPRLPRKPTSALPSERDRNGNLRRAPIALEWVGRETRHGRTIVSRSSVPRAILRCGAARPWSHAE